MGSHKGWGGRDLKDHNSTGSYKGWGGRTFRIVALWDPTRVGF